MCDQDHFEDDRREFEARGLVTHKQFGATLGAGVASDEKGIETFLLHPSRWT